MPAQSDKALKTTADMQVLLVILFLVFIIGVKFYMVITTSQNNIASRQKGDTYTASTNHSGGGYAQLSGSSARFHSKR